jgi:hypothetical protein
LPLPAQGSALIELEGDKQLGKLQFGSCVEVANHTRRHGSVQVNSEGQDVIDESSWCIVRRWRHQLLIGDQEVNEQLDHDEFSPEELSIAVLRRVYFL